MEDHSTLRQGNGPMILPWHCAWQKAWSKSGFDPIDQLERYLALVADGSSLIKRTLF